MNKKKLEGLYTDIEWTWDFDKDGRLTGKGATLNLWWGCEKVENNPCCDECYAERLANRFGSNWGKMPRRYIGGWESKLNKLQKEAVKQNRIIKVFVMSMGDLFEKSMPMVEHTGGQLKFVTGYVRREFLEKVWRKTWPNLLFMCLTKRPSNVVRMVPESWLSAGWPVNFMIGTSAGDQKNLDVLMKHMSKIPAKYKFLSLEPIFEELDLSETRCGRDNDGDHNCWVHTDGCPNIDFIITGGESGPRARPTNPDHVRAVRDQCRDMGVPFFFKQWGDWWPTSQSRSIIMEAVDRNKLYKFRDVEGVGSFRKVGKKVAGAKIDGEEWRQFPQYIIGDVKKQADYVRQVQEV